MNEVCPCCGDFVVFLLEESGWCATCVAIDLDGRWCAHCRLAKRVGEFNGHKSGACRQCQTEMKRRWRAANVEHSRAYEAARQARRRLARAASA